jgi:hypothetical protein
MMPSREAKRGHRRLFARVPRSPARAWVWALAVGLWVPLMGLALDPAGFHPASVLALAFATVGANAGAIVGRFLAESDPAR